MFRRVDRFINYAEDLCRGADQWHKQKEEALTTWKKNILHLYGRTRRSLSKPLASGSSLTQRSFTDKRWVQPHANRGQGVLGLVQITDRLNCTAKAWLAAPADQSSSVLPIVFIIWSSIEPFWKCSVKTGGRRSDANDAGIGTTDQVASNAMKRMRSRSGTRYDARRGTFHQRNVRRKRLKRGSASTGDAIKKKKRWKTKSNQWDKVQSRKLVAKRKEGRSTAC
jgi:hypothetical protein